MDKIKFKVKEKVRINFSMGMGIKEIHPPIENLEVIPTKKQQVFNHENSYGYDNVTVNAIPDEYIIPDGTLEITENTTYDVTPYSRVSASVHPIPNLQDKELTINENGTHIIVADEEYDALNKVSVTVDAIEDLTNELATYNTELTNQETTLDNLIQTLSSKGIDSNAKELITSYISLIDDSLGLNCTKLPSDITIITKDAFRNRTNLPLTELPDTITSIGENAFYYCKNLALTKLPENITFIDDGAFYNCTNLLLTELPKAIKTISTNTFYGCINLALTELPDAVTYIGQTAFYGCTGLTSLKILGNITTIKANAFSGCTNLSIIALPNITSVPTGGSSMFKNTLIANGTGYIYVPDTLVDTFKETSQWIDYASQIKGISEMGV